MLTVVLFLMSLFLSGSHQQCFSDNDFVGYHTTAQLYSWAKTRINFSVSLFKAINKEMYSRNLVFSPWSIREALLLAYFAARNETEASIAKVLQIPAKQSKPLTWWFYNLERKAYVDKEIQVNNHQLKSANKIFISRKLSLRRCIQEKFGNELERIDYERDFGQWAKNRINAWVESVTEGQIKDFYNEISPNTPACLVNAVYLKSKWVDKFDPNKTRTMPFRVNSLVSRPAKMMVKTAKYIHGYSKTLGARMLLLPYEGNRSAMILLLPDDDLDATIQSLNTITVGMIIDLSVYKKGYFELIIPKFEHRSNIALGFTLSSLGIGNAFTRSADFSGFTGRNEVFFDDVIHEAVIDVDEEGTKAAAATGSVPMSATNPLDFRCDRPFAYVIYDFLAAKILFMGTFREP